jgi:hypothetical protein
LDARRSTTRSDAGLRRRGRTASDPDIETSLFHVAAQCGEVCAGLRFETRSCGKRSRASAAPCVARCAERLRRNAEPLAMRRHCFAALVLRRDFRSEHALLPPARSISKWVRWACACGGAAPGALADLGAAFRVSTRHDRARRRQSCAGGDQSHAKHTAQSRVDGGSPFFRARPARNGTKRQTSNRSSKFPPAPSRSCKSRCSNHAGAR